MVLKLNRTQRWLCVVGAAGIVIGLLFQAQDVGLAETNWIIGSLVVLVLLGLAAAKPQARDRSTMGKRGEVLVSQLRHYDIAYERALAFLRSQARAATGGDTFAGMKIGKNDADLLVDQHFQAISSKFAYMLVYLASHKQDLGFVDTGRDKQLEMRAVGKFIAPTTKNLAAMPVDDVPPRQRAVGVAGREFARCKTAIRLSIGAFSTGAADPMDPVYHVVEGEAGLAAAKKLSLEATYGPVSREIMEISA